MQSRTLYPSAKFVALPQSQNTAAGRRNYILWIIIIIIFLSIILSCSSWVTLYVKNYTRGAPVSNKSAPSHHSLNMPSVWKFTNYVSTPEDFCQESHKLQAIPANLIAQVNTNDARGLMNAALFLHVERLVTKRGPEELRNVFDEYNRKLASMSTFDEFVDFATGLNSKEVMFCLRHFKSEGDLRDSFGGYFALVEELDTWYSYLHRLGSFLTTYEQQKRREFYVNVTDVNFYKFTTETQGKLFRSAYPFNLTRKKILELNDVIQGRLKPLHVELKNSTWIFSNRVVILSEVIRKMPDAETVYVLCGETLYLDDDVTLPGVNLGIIAPRWVFLRKIKINLNGADGSEHKEKPNGSGKPGNPGGNAGDFLGVGDWDEENLTVTANGGRGGRGQDGENGHDGADHTHPDPPFNKPRCLRKVNAFRNPFNQTITRYKIFGESGCGGPGSDGGIGGAGGKGGVVILISKSVQIIKGSSGEFGSPGKGGRGGAGGKNGCFYEVLDVNDEVLHRVTNVQCAPGNVLPSGKSGKDNQNGKGLTRPRIKQNLSVCDCFVHYIRKVDLKNIPGAISTLRYINRFDGGTECLWKMFDAYKQHDSVELYQNFLEEINPKFKPLRSLLLGRILILKTNVNYFFMDYVDYLNVIEKSIGSTNGRALELEPIAYLKRQISAKADKLGHNLKVIKSKLLNMNELEEFGGEKRMTCVMMTTMDAMFSLLNGPKVERIRKLDRYLRECLAPDEYIVDGNTDIILPGNKKFEVLLMEPKDVGGYLEKLRSAFDVLKGSLGVVRWKRKLLGELADEVGHLAALCGLREWEESAATFFRSLETTTEEKEEAELSDILILLQWKLAEDAARQKEYPFIEQNFPPRVINNNTTLTRNALDRVKVLRETPRGSLICKNELEAYFGGESAVGEFYYWPNVDVKLELETLFSGAEARLESSLINRHVLDKNFIRFKSLKLELETGDVEREKVLRSILLDYKMSLVHSGYSHYNWMGDSHVVMSEEATFELSFKTRENGEPELYNVLYKRVQNGDVTLSPYTTWSVRLIPVNERANFEHLKPYKDLVSLKLTGTGTFIP